jgi:hypothetical protein
MVWPAIAAAVGSSLLGGGLDLIGNNQTNQVNKGIANQQHQDFLAQMAMEKEFAQNGLSWKIADAAKNNISPLAALGATGASYNPVGTVGDIAPVSPYTVASRHVADMGQNISRAISAQASPEEKTLQRLDIIHRQKENDLLDTQIANSRLNILKQSQPPGIEKAWTTVINRDGSSSVVPSESIARSSHAETFGPLMWSIHNGVIPSVQEIGGGLRNSYQPDVRGWRTIDVQNPPRRWEMK